jgi:hypothetical protein
MSCATFTFLYDFFGPVLWFVLINSFKRQLQILLYYIALV